MLKKVEASLQSLIDTTTPDRMVRAKNSKSPDAIMKWLAYHRSWNSAVYHINIEGKKATKPE